MKTRFLVIFLLAAGLLAACAPSVDQAAWKNCVDQTVEDLVKAGESRTGAKGDASATCREELADGTGAFNSSWLEHELIEAPEPEPEPAAEEGSREDPFEIGDVVTLTEATLDAWEIELGSPARGATATVLAENRYNDVPPEGSEWVLLPVAVTRLGTEGVSPWLEFQFAFVSDKGVTYEETSGVIPTDFQDIADLYEGGQGTGNVGFVIPTSELSGGAWRVTYGYSLDFFFRNP